MRLARSPALYKHPLFLAALWGALAALCVPPLPLGPAIPLALFGMLASLRGRSGWAAARSGFVWGIVFHALSLHWIRNVMAVGPALVIGVGVTLLMAYLSIFPALWAWAWTRCRDRGLAWAWPFLFAAIEVLRGFGQMSLPWLHVGYGFGEWPVLLQGASLIGIHGLGFLIALTAVGLLASMRPGRWGVRTAIILGWLAWLGFGAWNLSRPEEGAPLRVAVVQPSIPQTRKWDESYFRTVMDKTHAALARLDKPVDLVVLPETAMPDFWSLRPWEASRFRRVSDSLGADLVVGSLDFDRDSLAPKGAWVRNSAFLLSPHEREARYDKMRLVPFSERIPFDDIFPLLNYVDLGEGDFAAGDSMAIWKSAGVAWAPSICYELVYPDFARLAARRGAQVLVDITNDGWFGRSQGPWQHWNIERFRAVETGLPLVRAANTGISGAVDAHGRIVSVTRLMDDTLTTAVVRAGTPSFAGRHGGLIEAFLALSGLAVFIGAFFVHPGSRAVS